MEATLQGKHGFPARHPGLWSGEQTCVGCIFWSIWARAVCLQVACRTAIWMGGRAGWRKNMSPSSALWRLTVSDQLRHIQLGEQLVEAYRSYGCFATWKSVFFACTRARFRYPKSQSCTPVASYQQCGCTERALEGEAEVNGNHLFCVCTAISLFSFMWLFSAGGDISKLFHPSVSLVSLAPCFQCLE